VEQFLKAFVRGKLENQVNLLRAMVKNRREHDPQCFEEVHIIVAEVRDALLSAEAISGKTCDDIRQRLLAAEGRGAERYWTGVRRLLLADLDWPSRQTQGATDPLNAALNYGYGILFDMFERKERERLIEMAGAVETLEDKTTWADVSSYSRRQGNAPP
jgi:CRISPR-associated protein Cas1